MSRKNVGEAARETLKEDWQHELAEEIEFIGFDEAERGRLTKQSIERFKSELAEEGDERAVQLFDALGESKQKDLLKQIAETEHIIEEKKYKLLERSMIIWKVKKKQISPIKEKMLKLHF